MPPGSFVVLFGGPAGAGKTTLARAWCLSRPLAVHIELDAVLSLIVSGLLNPQVVGPEQGEQYVASVRATCALARSYHEAGYDVAVDDVLPPGAFEADWKPALEGLPWRVLIVLPDLDLTLSRSAQRTKRVKPELTRQQHAASIVWPAELQLDTTGLTVAESLALARRRNLLP